jgi:hypothetical protein
MSLQIPKIYPMDRTPTEVEFESEKIDDSDHFRSMIEYEKELMVQHHQLLFQLRDPKIYNEFTDFMHYSKSSRFMFLVNLVFTFLVIPLVGINTVETDGFSVLSVLALVLSLISFVLLWILYFYQCNQIQDNFNWACFTSFPVRHLQVVLLASLTTLFSLVNIHRSTADDCNDDVSWLYLWTCNPYAESKTLPYDTTLILMLIPILFVIIMRETNLVYIFLSWVTTIVALFTCAILLESSHSYVFLLFYVLLSFVIIMDVYKQNFVLFILGRQLKRRLERNQLKATQEKALQMRNMIGNVAHDLKTVRSLLFLIFLVFNTYSFISRLLPL